MGRKRVIKRKMMMMMVKVRVSDCEGDEEVVIIMLIIKRLVMYL